jgi:hypothetical protein
VSTVVSDLQAHGAICSWQKVARVVGVPVWFATNAPLAPATAPATAIKHKQAQQNNKDPIQQSRQ